MNLPLAQPMELDEFLLWERRQELCFEFDGIQPVAMTGGSVAHSVIATNVVRALDDRLTGPCRVFRGDLKIVVAGRVRYPDAVVTCAPVADETDIVPEPLIVFEVLSPGTALVDRNVKAAEYHATPSIRRCVMLEQGRAEAISLERSGAIWRETRLAGLDAILVLPEVAVTVPLAELYRRVQGLG
ncbi:MAG: Uma2 family endonuclease [Acetobacteraceae bacterium]